MYRTDPTSATRQNRSRSYFRTESRSRHREAPVPAEIKRDPGDIFLDAVIERFNILAFFPDIDRDLIALACRTDRHIPFAYGSSAFSHKIEQNLIKRYSILKPNQNYQALEFYGDKVLYMAMVDTLSTLLGLNTTPGELTELVKQTTRNNFLTSLSKKLGVCELFPVDQAKLRLHNVCSDSTESVIGAVYFQYKTPALGTIFEWINSLHPLSDLIEELVYPVVAANETAVARLHIPHARVDVRGIKDSREAVKKIAKAVNGRLVWSREAG